MAGRRSRKRHVQTELLNQAGTRARPPRGGKRPGAGRPPKHARAGSPHKRRPSFKANVPCHIVLRVERAIGNLRRRAIYKAILAATIVAARSDLVRIVHVSIQRSHIHLIVEAQGRLELARGLQAFQISAARRINRAVVAAGKPARRGRVFSDRYHAELLTNRLQAHRALGYVLNNWRKHREDVLDKRARGWLVDPFSTAMQFTGWKERAELRPWPPGYEPLVVRAPATWMLRQGWARYGPISCRAVPSKPAVAARAA